MKKINCKQPEICNSSLIMRCICTETDNVKAKPNNEAIEVVVLNIDAIGLGLC